MGLLDTIMGLFGLKKDVESAVSSASNLAAKATGTVDVDDDDDDDDDGEERDYDLEEKYGDYL